MLTDTVSPLQSAHITARTSKFCCEAPDNRLGIYSCFNQPQTELNAKADI